jgi:hypothetical protein
MTYEQAIEKIMPDVDSGSTEPFINSATSKAAGMLTLYMSSLKTSGTCLITL